MYPFIPFSRSLAFFAATSAVQVVGLAPSVATIEGQPVKVQLSAEITGDGASLRP